MEKYNILIDSTATLPIVKRKLSAFIHSSLVREELGIGIYKYYGQHIEIITDENIETDKVIIDINYTENNNSDKINYGKFNHIRKLFRLNKDANDFQDKNKNFSISERKI